MIYITIFLLLLIMIIIYDYILKVDPGFLWVNFNNNMVNIKELKNIFLRDVNILNKLECNKIKNRILSNKNYFIKRNLIMSTLGRASYLGDELTPKYIKENNTFLLNLFPYLYSRLQNILSKTLNKKVIYKKNSFLPGFHIFGSSWLFNMNVAKFHVDMQYLHNDISNCNIERVISFTLPVDLPKDISGLYMFQAYKNNNKEIASKSKKALIKYRVGNIYIHDGNNYHIMKPSKILDNEYRITLQGHGVLCNNVWNIYW